MMALLDRYCYVKLSLERPGLEPDTHPLYTPPVVHTNR